jgi:hypothetical protein
MPWIIIFLVVAGGAVTDCGGGSGHEDAAADESSDTDAADQHDAAGDPDGASDPDGLNDTDEDAVTTGIIPWDRRVDWRPGIPGGIPAYDTVCANVREAPYNAAGNGSADDSGAIQAAIDDCPEGQVVYVPEGTYRVATGLSIQKGIVLRGDGPDRTRIEGDGVGEKAIIQVGSWDENPAEIDVESGLSKGSASLVVGDVSEFTVGDFVIVDQENDGDLVRVEGSESPCTWGSRNEGARLLGQISVITSLDSGTRTIGIDPGLAMELSPGLNPQVTKLRNNVPQRAGIEDLYVADRSYRGSNNANIRFWGTAYSWIRNVESAYVSGRHVQLTKCFRCEVRDSIIHFAHVYDPGANAYGISVENQTTDTLIENNIVTTLNVGIVGASSGPGNVIAYNYMDEMYERSYPDAPWLMADLSANHCGHPFMNLWEGNMVSQISGDNIHGSSSHQTFFRNYVDRQHEGFVHTGNLTDVVFAATNRFMNMVGNVLGRPGDDALPGAVYDQESGNCLDTVAVYKLGYPSDCGIDTITDPQVKETILRHGNFDYFSNATVWDPAITERSLPPSLFRSGKPDYFGDVPWPPIGPDVTDLVSDIPAKIRFDSLP